VTVGEDAGTLGDVACLPEEVLLYCKSARSHPTRHPRTAPAPAGSITTRVGSSCAGVGKRRRWRAQVAPPAERGQVDRAPGWGPARRTIRRAVEAILAGWGDPRTPTASEGRSWPSGRSPGFDDGLMSRWPRRRPWWGSWRPCRKGGGPDRRSGGGSSRHHPADDGQGWPRRRGSRRPRRVDLDNTEGAGGPESGDGDPSTRHGPTLGRPSRCVGRRQAR